jgi:hypothetical protein
MGGDGIELPTSCSIWQGVAPRARMARPLAGGVASAWRVTRRRRDRPDPRGYPPNPHPRATSESQRVVAPDTREADAELDKLALRSRLAVIGAGKLDAATLTQVYDKLIERAMGDGHVANGAAKILLDLARATVDDVPRDTETISLEEMSREERVALYARVLAATTGDADADPTPGPPPPASARDS